MRRTKSLEDPNPLLNLAGKHWLENESEAGGTEADSRVRNSAERPPITQTNIASPFEFDRQSAAHAISSSCNFETERSWIFFELNKINLPSWSTGESMWRRVMSQDCTDDEFHDSESEDIFDLYNACNGILRNDLLDIRKLDELSPEELEAFNVPRLREIWSHTASGCTHCASIVQALNKIRGSLNKTEHPS